MADTEVERSARYAPLSGLHVLELACGIAGPYAGRLLALLGATVVKIEPEGGDPARHKPVDDAALAGTSPLFLHLNAGKQNRSAGTVPLTWVDVVIDDRVRADLAGTDLDPARPGSSGPLLVSITAFGFDDADAGTLDEDVLAQARSGIIGVTGDPGREPLRLAGWQAQYMAGAAGAVGALAGLRSPGCRHVDVSWTACLMTGMELHFADGLVSQRRRVPVGPFPKSAFPGGALPCRDGHVVPGSFREVDWEMQCLFYGLPELIEDDRYKTRAARAERIDEVWELIRPWYAAHTKDEIFQLCLETPWTVGKVMTGVDALTDPQLAERGALGPIDTPDGPAVAPIQPFRTSGLPVADQRVRVTGEDDRVPLPPRSGRIERRPFDGVRLLEVTVAWAGPYVGNLLGALGMDVVKFEANRPFEGYRVLRLFADSDPDELHHMKADNRWFEASALHNAVNRNKQGVVIDLSTTDGREIFLDFARVSDVVLCNFTAKVLPQLGLAHDDLVAVNEDIIVVRMPAFGTMGPYSGAAGYGPIVEGMGGFGARFGYEDEGARISDLYWPDPIAGMHAALAIGAAVERRDRGRGGSDIDLSHMDVTWFQNGETIVVASQRGTPIGRMGNREPGVATSGFEQRDGRWWARSGTRYEVVNEVLDAAADPRLASRFEVVDHPITGPVRQLRSPFVMDGRPTTTRRPAPRFDQDTDALLAERLGYSSERIATLRAARVIGGTLPPPSLLGL